MMTLIPVRVTGLVAFLAVGAFASDPVFLARRDYPLLDEEGIAVADTNGDGVLDVIGLSIGEATVMLGTGKGTFTQGPVSQTGMYVYPTKPVAAQLHAHGIVDLVLSGGQISEGPYGVGVLFGNGDGTFQPAVFYSVGTDTSPGNPALGDFNGDGIPDMAVVASSGLWLFTGKGGGQFNPGVLMPVPGAGVDNRNQTVAVDFNGDGKIDVAILTPTGFLVLFGNGDGTFQSPQPYTSPSGHPGWYAVAAPLRPGHRPDLVMAYETALGGAASTVAVYLNNGSGTFAAPSLASLPTGGSFSIGDVNGDGIPDLVSGAGYVALGNGNGTFRPPTYYPLPGGITVSSVALADLRHSGRKDLVFQDGDNELSVLLNFGKGRLEDGEWIPVAGGADCGAAADYNGDGKPDLAVNTATGISILLGTGKALAPFQYGATISLTSAGCLVTGDLNNDGIPDLLVPSNGTVVAFLGNGDGTFRQASTTSTPSGGYLALGDFNHDGKLDFATSGNLLACGNGDGTFQVPVQIMPTLTGSLSGIATGDVNGDGWTDIVATYAEPSSEIYILLNNQHGGFIASYFHAVNSSNTPIDPTQVVLAKLTTGGNLDMVVAGILGGDAVYRGDGKGGFTYAQDLNTNGSPLVVGDTNGDGVPDIVLGGTGTLIYLGNGDGTFTPPAYYIGGGPSPGDIILENLHGQSSGFPDIVLPDLTGGVMALINTTNELSAAR